MQRTGGIVRAAAAGIGLIIHLSLQAAAQPFHESFDTTPVPLLPAGWSTSKAKLISGDFQTTTSVPYSPPASVMSTDARIAQWLGLPPLSFAGKKVQALEFYERRSSSFNAGMLIEAAFAPDDSLWIPLSDTLTLLSSSSNYIRRTIPLPSWLDDKSAVRLRFRTLGNGTGSTGTLRLDEITLSFRAACDLALGDSVTLPSRIDAGADIACTFTVTSRLSSGAYTATLMLWDSSANECAAEETFTHTYGHPGDSLSVTLFYRSLLPGRHRMHCRLSSSDDEDTTNNTVSFTLSASAGLHALVINEIMYDPAPDRPEYIELVNTTSLPLSLEGWTIADAPPSKKNRHVVALAPHARNIAPHGYALIASDSAIIEQMERSAASALALVAPSLSLANTGEAIILSDAEGTVIDSLCYSPAWHIRRSDNAGRSLEKIHPSLASCDARSWSTSASAQGGTPGAANSVFASLLPSDAALKCAPNPFSPDGDGRDDHCAISYMLPSRASTIRLRIFDAQGRLVRLLANAEFSGSSGTIIWNGCDDAGARVRMGIYIIFLEALDDAGTSLRALKASAVVASPL